MQGLYDGDCVRVVDDGSNQGNVAGRSKRVECGSYCVGIGRIAGRDEARREFGGGRGESVVAAEGLAVRIFLEGFGVVEIEDAAFFGRRNFANFVGVSPYDGARAFVLWRAQ